LAVKLIAQFIGIVLFEVNIYLPETILLLLSKGSNSYGAVMLIVNRSVKTHLRDNKNR